MSIREACAQVKANKKLAQKVDSVLSKEVFEEIRDTEIATIESVVYVYDPREYIHRGEYGGMADPYNIEMKGGAASGGVLTVVNATESDDRYEGSTRKTLPELIEYGHSKYCSLRGVGYDFISKVKLRRDKYMVPRPFTKKTVETLEQNRDHIVALRTGLIKRGVKVK